MKRVIVLSIAVLALTLAGLAPAVAQTGQMFGELVGKVTDDQGGLLPGVTVTLSGPAVMGTQTAVTNERGTYRFPGVNSGTYTLRFELAGFAPLVRAGIVVPVRQTITVDAAMKIASLQETVTVSGVSPVVDVENAKLGARLDQHTLQSVPTSRTIFGAATVLPGMTMVRQDPGGLNAATSTGMVAHGAATYNLNYYGVTADTPQDYGSMYYMDYGSAEEISVDTAAMGAEIGGGGGANINVIPKSGGNTVKGEAVYSATGRGYWGGFSGNNITSDLRAQGVKNPTLQKLNDLNANAGGPFIKDRLWWFGSYRNYTTEENVAGFPIPFDSNLRNYTTSGKYQITKNNQLSAFWTYATKAQPHRGAGVVQQNPMGTISQHSPKNLFNANYTSVLGQNTFLEVSSSYFHMNWPSIYADEFYALPDSQKTMSMYNITTGIFFNGPDPTGERRRQAYRAQTNIGVTRYIDGFLGASHQVKTGFEDWIGWGSDGYDIYGDTVLEYKTVNGVLTPTQIQTFNTPLTQKTHMKNLAAFVQDRISYQRVTVNLGVRWSLYDGYLPEQTGGGGRWFPLVTYPELSGGYTWNTFAPRSSVVFKLTEDGKNVAKASYSRYYEVMYTGEFANVINPNTINVLSTSSGSGGLATYQWFGDLNGNGKVDDNEYNHNPLSTLRPKLNRIDPNLRDPKNDEITFGYQRELLNNLGLNVTWIQRWFRDVTVNEEVGIPVNGYTPHTVTDPGPDNLINTADDKQITLYDVLPQYRGQNVSYHTNHPGTQQYKTLEITVNKRMSNRWQLMGSYSWSRLDGSLFVDPNNPNLNIPSNAEGRGSNDQPHAFKLLCAYQAPLGITLGANYQGVSGLPRDRTLAVSLTQGSTTVRVEPRGTYRYDFLNLLSLRADKAFKVGGQRRIALVAEVHNVLNSNANQSSVGTATRSFASQAAFDAARLTTSYFGRVQEIVAPRILKLGVRFQF